MPRRCKDCRGITRCVMLRLLPRQQAQKTFLPWSLFNEHTGCLCSAGIALPCKSSPWIIIIQTSYVALLIQIIPRIPC